MREKTREKNDEPEPDSTSRIYIIIGVGLVAILLAVYIIVYEIFKRRRKKAQSQQNNNSETLLTKVPWLIVHESMPQKKMDEKQDISADSKIWNADTKPHEPEMLKTRYLT